MDSATFRAITLDLTPCEVAARLRSRGGLVFFDSARTDHAYGRRSLVAAMPSQIWRGCTAADWAAFECGLQRHVVDSTGDGLPHGFAAGWCEYEGAFCFALYERLLVYEHAARRWLSLGGLERDLVECPPPAPEAPAPHFVPDLERLQFLDMVRRAQDYIAAGDIYQVNLSHRFQAACALDPWVFYETLRMCSPAPFAAFLELDGRAVLSSSPELFLKMSGAHVCTRPIKGTRPRRTDAQADARSACELQTSPKEIAELVMITDLERNDLGRVCLYGSVRVAELLRLERFAQVFHLVSTVEGRLRPGVTQSAAFRACFPGGSITGAPKKRAMEIIAELEPVPRGLYTGAIGWFGLNGESQFSIAIRTAIVEAGAAHFHVGAGIVADSEPEAEYAETLDKAAGLLTAAARAGGREEFLVEKRRF